LPPADSARCPSKWAPATSVARQPHEPQTVLNAAKLIKTGEVIELSIPQCPDAARGRSRLRYAGQAHRGERPANKRNGNEELIIAEMGQVGTQFDGFAHQTHNNVHYNCFKTEDIATRNGFTKLGIEKVGMLMTRGV